MPNPNEPLDDQFAGHRRQGDSRRGRGRPGRASDQGEVIVEVTTELLSGVVGRRTWVLGHGDSAVVVSAGGPMLSVVSDSDVSETLSAFVSAGLVRLGRAEPLPSPFDDKLGAPLIVTILGRLQATKPVRVIECPEPRVPAAQPISATPPKRRRGKKTSRRSRSPKVRARMAKVRRIDRVCRYCLSAAAETADHVVPVSRGGGNSAFNLVGCCLDCNGSKDDLLPKEARMVLHVPLRWFTADGMSVWR